MKRTNFDRYLEEQMKDPEFAARFEHAGEAWEVALQLAALRQQAGLSQKELARRLKTSQQHRARTKSPRGFSTQITTAGHSASRRLSFPTATRGTNSIALCMSRAE